MTTQDVLDAYGEAWNEQEEAKRRQLLETCWADDGTFTDPQSDIAGREALVAHIAEFHAQFAGAEIVPTSTASVSFGFGRDAAGASGFGAGSTVSFEHPSSATSATAAIRLPIR